MFECNASWKQGTQNKMAGFPSSYQDVQRLVGRNPFLFSKNWCKRWRQKKIPRACVACVYGEKWSLQWQRLQGLTMKRREQTLTWEVKLGADYFTQKAFHTNTVRRRCFYTETLLNTEFLHTDAFTNRPFYTRHLHTQRYLYKDAFTHRPSYTHTLCTQAPSNHIDWMLHTPSFVQTDASTHRPFYTQTPAHRCTIIL